MGVDIGGTNTKLGLVDREGKIVAQETELTARLDQPDAVCQFIAEAGERLAGHYGLSLESLGAIGVAMPGILDMKHGVLKELSNLLRWIDYPLRDKLSHFCGRPVSVLNDASAAAFGEFTQRNMPQQSLALITLGTGIGSGIVMNGEPLGGDHGCAGEIGHAVIDVTDAARSCGCGKPGHLEAYAGSGGVIATARAMLTRLKEDHSLASSSSLANYLDLELTPEVIASEAERGDRVAMEVVMQTARHIGVGVAVLCHCLDPSLVLLGGAMTFGQSRTETGRRFLAEITTTVDRFSLRQIAGNVQIDFAKLGGEAGMLGAAVYASQHTNRP